MTSQQAGGIDLDTYALNRNLDTATLHAIAGELGLKQVGTTAFSAAHWQALEDCCRLRSPEHERAPTCPASNATACAG